VVNLVAAHKWFNVTALKAPRRRDSAAPRGRGTDVGRGDRHCPARGPYLDDGALIVPGSLDSPIPHREGADPVSHPGAVRVLI
jgi:hypothetical protein